MKIQPLLSAERIAQRVRELGEQITLDCSGSDLTVIGVLNGALMFVADLIRVIDVPHQLGFVQASSYREGTTAGPLHVDLHGLPELANRDVLLVDDILDTGHTLSRLRAELEQRGVRSLRTAVLLWKSSRTLVDLRADYVGFEIDDHFVVGYGLDFNGTGRHLPYIGTIDPVAKSDAPARSAGM